MDDYVLDSVYAFCQNKTKIKLGTNRLSGLNMSFLMMLYYGIATTASYDIPDDKSNIFRSVIFDLFPNLVELQLWTNRHPFNPLSLLSVLGETTIPSSFQVLKMDDWEQAWLREAFDGNVGLKEQYAANGWEFEVETIWASWGQKDADWLFMRKCE